MNTETTRNELKPFQGQRLHFTGVLQKFGDLAPCHKRKHYTVCVENLHCKKHNLSFDHMWIKLLPHQIKYVHEGEKFCFNGEVREYLRGYHKLQFTHEWIDWSVDYGLVDIKIVLPKPKQKSACASVSKIKKRKRKHLQLIKPKWMK